ncbi:MAG: DUF5916 domain-containing protein [bacterium]
MRFCLFVVLAYLSVQNLSAQINPEPAEPPTKSKIAQAKRISGVPPVIDGDMIDEIWNTATPVDDFLQKDPKEGQKPSGVIEVRFLYDDEYIYIGAAMLHNTDKEIRATVSRRDQSGNSERIIISLDSYKDKRTAYTFGLTASNVRFDYYHGADNEYDRDYSFDPVWEGQARINGDCWHTELRIPFSQLRFNDIEEQVWGLNINWWIPSLREDVYWVLIPKNEAGWSSKMGSLVGIKNIEPSSRIEILPYVAGNALYNPNYDKNNPFSSELDYKGRIGLDFKMGLGPDFSIDATINPDFGQVEADPAVVNLTAYETFYEEKRPFFIEGKGLLQGYSESFFYSRRIGQAPRGTIQGDVVDVPQNSNILGAAKITGRTSTGLSLGALTALTGKEYGKYLFFDNDSTSETLMNPLSNYSVVRLKQEFGQDVSSVGFLLTNVYRDISKDDNLSSVYLKNATSCDFDWLYRFDSATYQLDGHLGFSYVQGEKEALLNLQRHSSHYFQRPDAEHVKIDSNATDMSGFAGLLKLSKIAGKHWLWELLGSFETPGLELNDIGQLYAGDEIYSGAAVKYRENVPGNFFYDYGIKFSVNNTWDFGGNYLTKNLALIANSTFHDRSTFAIGSWYELQGLSNSITRGGPLMATYDSRGAMLQYNSDWSANNQITFYVEANQNKPDGWDFTTLAKFTLKTIGRLEFSIEPTFMSSVNPRQYVTTISGNGGSTYDTRYIFSEIKRYTLLTRFRLNMAFTSDFTLEYYVEPFVANGDYFHFGELAEAGTHDLKYYGEEWTTINKFGNKYLVHDGANIFTFDNPDFNYLSFRSNLVLRWEYIPGSTVYLVWQQNKSNYDNLTGKVDLNTLMDSYSAKGVNSIALKVSYWLPVD